MNCQMFGKANCTLVHLYQEQIPVGLDEVTCEPIFETRETEETLRVSLEKDTTEPVVASLSGKDKTKHFHSGKASVLPANLPSWYKPGAQLTVRFDDGFEALGYIYYSAPSRLGLDSCFGATIELVLNY